MDFNFAAIMITYLSLSLFVSCVLIFIFWAFGYDLKNAVELVASGIQIIAIIASGIWAYQNFGWEKKEEDRRIMRQLLLKYTEAHRKNLANYRNVNSENKKNALSNYKIQLAAIHNEILEKLNILAYPSKKMKDKIRRAIFLPMKIKEENLEEVITEFNQKMNEIEQELEGSPIGMNTNKKTVSAALILSIIINIYFICARPTLTISKDISWGLDSMDARGMIQPINYVGPKDWHTIFYIHFQDNSWEGKPSKFYAREVVITNGVLVNLFLEEYEIIERGENHIVARDETYEFEVTGNDVFITDKQGQKSKFRDIYSVNL